MRIAMYQYHIVSENTAANLALIKKAAHDAVRKGAKILCLPEMCTTGYSMTTRLAEPFDETSPTLQALKKIASTAGISLLGSIMRADGTTTKNTACCITPNGKVEGWYDKIHLFPLSGEDKLYVPGTGISSFVPDSRQPECRATMFVCYDLRFPELFRAAIEQWPDLTVIFVPANWPTSRLSHWRTLLAARAIENQLFVVGINRCGSDPKNAYPGHSLVIDPLGNELNMPTEKEGLIIVDLPLEQVFEVRKQFPFLASRQPAKAFKKMN